MSVDNRLKEICDKYNGRYKYETSNLFGEISICSVNNKESFREIINNNSWYSGEVVYTEHDNGQHIIIQYVRRLPDKNDSFIVTISQSKKEDNERRERITKKLKFEIEGKVKKLKID